MLGAFCTVPNKVDQVVGCRSGAPLGYQRTMPSNWPKSLKSAHIMEAILRNHNFLLNLNSRLEQEELTDLLFEAGCDDAILFQRDGFYYLEFDRVAPNLAEAIETALQDIRKIGLSAKTVEPSDWVNLTEMAERIGKSREYLRSLLAGERNTTPPPAPISGSNAKNRLWRWSEASAWLAENTQLVERETVIEAWQIREVNEALSLNEPAPAYFKSSALYSFRMASNRKPSTKKSNKNHPQ